MKKLLIFVLLFQAFNTMASMLVACQDTENLNISVILLAKLNDKNEMISDDTLESLVIKKDNQTVVSETDFYDSHSKFYVDYMDGVIQMFLNDSISDNLGIPVIKIDLFYGTGGIKLNPLADKPIKLQCGYVFSGWEKE